jgi:hypothetical protein
MSIQKKYETVLGKMKLVAKSSLHNKPPQEKLISMIKLRNKLDLEEKIRLEKKKKEDEEKLENYYISLKNKEKEFGVGVGIDNITNTHCQSIRSFFISDQIN